MRRIVVAILFITGMQLFGQQADLSTQLPKFGFGKLSWALDQLGIMSASIQTLRKDDRYEYRFKDDLSEVFIISHLASQYDLVWLTTKSPTATLLGIRIGATLAEVKAKLGKPLSETTGKAASLSYSVAGSELVLYLGNDHVTEMDFSPME